MMIFDASPPSSESRLHSTVMKAHLSIFFCGKNVNEKVQQLMDTNSDDEFFPNDEFLLKSGFTYVVVL